MVGSLCFGYSEIVFVLLTKVIIGYVVIFFINVKKTCLERMFTRAFYSYKSGFYYYSNNVLYVLICINFCRGSEAFKSYCQYI